MILLKWFVNRITPFMKFIGDKTKCNWPLHCKLHKCLYGEGVDRFSCNVFISFAVLPLLLWALRLNTFVSISQTLYGPLPIVTQIVVVIILLSNHWITYQGIRTDSLCHVKGKSCSSICKRENQNTFRLQFLLKT